VLFLKGLKQKRQKPDIDFKTPFATQTSKAANISLFPGAPLYL
jgi:hypothetical protein